MNVRALIADGLVGLGVVVITVAVYGVLRLPDTLTRLHSASKAAALGVMILLLASFTSENPQVMVRAIVVMFFLALTAPVGSHAIGRLEYTRRRREAAAEKDEAQT